nr:MAG TPA: hypothetical protein [Caudoviricetes sp.]
MPVGIHLFQHIHQHGVFNRTVHSLRTMDVLTVVRLQRVVIGLLLFRLYGLKGGWHQAGYYLLRYIRRRELLANVSPGAEDLRKQCANCITLPYLPGEKLSCQQVAFSHQNYRCLRPFFRQATVRLHLHPRHSVRR